MPRVPHIDSLPDPIHLEDIEATLIPGGARWRDGRTFDDIVTLSRLCKEVRRLRADAARVAPAIERMRELRTKWSREIYPAYLLDAIDALLAAAEGDGG
jgi:hypothetical protein